MKLALVIGMMFLFNLAQAKVVEKTPTVEAPNVKSELLNELDEVSEDLDFDSEDDLFINTIDESELIIDSEIEKIAQDQKTPAPTMEAQAPKNTEIKKK